MISVALGKRYERLLFFTAPLSLATILVCLVATASARQAERVDARCYVSAANAFEKKLDQLKIAFKAKKEKWEKSPLDYKILLSHIWIYGSDLSSPCYEKVNSEMESGLRDEGPDEIINYLNAKSKKLLETPLNAYGISLPKDATLDLYVTKININLLTLSRILQLVLLPGILLWLGSLYRTRYREALTIGRAYSIAEIFPHIINQYPAFDTPTIRKRNLLAPYYKPIWRFWYAIIRLILVMIFIMPPVAFYLYSIYLSEQEDSNLAYILAGFIIGLFSLSNCLAEFLPIHYYKVFQDPRNELRI